MLIKWLYKVLWNAGHISLLAICSLAVPPCPLHCCWFGYNGGTLLLKCMWLIADEIHSRDEQVTIAFDMISVQFTSSCSGIAFSEESWCLILACVWETVSFYSRLLKTDSIYTVSIMIANVVIYFTWVFLSNLIATVHYSNVVALVYYPLFGCANNRKHAQCRDHHAIEYSISIQWLCPINHYIIHIKN